MKTTPVSDTSVARLWPYKTQREEKHSGVVIFLQINDEKVVFSYKFTMVDKY